jgi:hypothetical protein
MPLKPHPTDPDLMVYVSRQYDLPQQTEVQRLIALVRAQQITIDKLEVALAQPEQEPVAHLWQHGETGRTRVIFPDSITDCDASWFCVGPLVLGNTTPPQENT